MARRAIRDVRRLGELDGRMVRDLLRATRELAVARWRLAKASPAELLQAPTGKSPSPRNCDEQVRRIAFAVGAMGARVPWRSDCLVQAVAGHRWLARLGIASEICVGVKPPSTAGLDAHAWLLVGDEVVIGGEVADYAPLVAPDRHRR